MTGFCRINDKDAFETFGIAFERGTFDELFSLPVPKERVVNDWPDEDGLDVDDVSPIRLQPRTLNPPMLIVAEGGDDAHNKYNLFREELYKSVYMDFEFPTVDVRFKLRFTGGGAVTTIGNFFRSGMAGMRFNVTFTDDFPRIIPLLPASVFDDMIFDDIILG
ncbi:hypothetical protein FKG96_12455 [Olivibacter sp. LS-1]|uniref:hypothetical protein n=1 Tax=Olivibacter sp. LS-1 TaxID=2592345 RepID=UPI0011EB86F2|nr:hypothetical protein [Olivibacter sp. LS-1]QEL01583.1 hypothetical protein FKG96_12455 [Olivibacter sp. LS-1]